MRPSSTGGPEWKTPEIEFRMVCAHDTMGRHLKAVVGVARGEKHAMEALPEGSVRDAIQQMRRTDLEDAYALLLEHVVHDHDVLRAFYVGRP